MTSEYIAPPKPKKGGKIHTHPYSHNGEILVIIQESKTFWVALARFWNPNNRRYYWEAVDSISWEYGLIRPGKAKKVHRHYPSNKSV